MKNNSYVIIIFLALVLLASLTTYGCRQYEIGRCQDNGGIAVTEPWWSERAAEVKCIR